MTFEVWKPKYDVRLGEDSQNTNLDRAAIAALPNGGYVVGWREGSQLKFKVYDGGGNPVGPNGGTVYSVTAGLTGGSAFQNALDIQAIGTDGSFAISWNEGTGGSFDLKTRVFTHNGDGNYVGGAANVIYAEATADTYLASMTGTTRGSIMSTFVRGNSIELVSHNGTGGFADSWLIPNGTNNETITNPEITQVTGAYVISYTQGNKTYVKIVTSLDNLPTAGIEVDDVAARAEVVALKDENGALAQDGFAVVWRVGHKLLAKFYNVNGSQMQGTGEVEITGDAGGDSFNVVALRGGRIAVSHSGNAADTGTRKAFLTITDAMGNKPQSVPLALGAAENQHSVRVVEMTDGRLAIAWEDPSRGFGDISSAIVDPRLVGVTVQGTARNDYYVGSEYKDFLFGNDGADVLVGGAGDDALYGGGGQDTFQGGVGKDTVSYRNAVARVEEGKTLGVEVYLHKPNGLSNAGEAHGDRFDGIEVIDGSLFADVLEGDGGNNEFWGDTGDDLLKGFGGNDTLKGSRGGDTFHGGAGVDRMEGDELENGTYVDDGKVDILTYTEAADAVTVDLEARNGTRGEAQGDSFIGMDELYGSSNSDILYGRNTDGDSHESMDDTIWGGRGNDVIVGRAGNDKLDGGHDNDTLEGGDGADSLYGFSGDDVLVGGLGLDLLDGGEGNDTVSYANNVTKVIVQLFDTSIQVGRATEEGQPPETLRSIEHAIGGSNNDTLTGSDTGNNLRGEGGNDSLEGGKGNDTLEGGVGSDTLRGGDDFDYASYERSTGGVTVSLLAGGTGDAVGDTFELIEGLIGSAAGDVMTGNTINNHLKGEGGNDTLNGGAGADTLEGGAGDDTYHVDALDTIIEGAGQGVDTVIVTTDFTLSPGAVIENIVLSTTATVRLLGNEMDNVLTGDAGTNILNGQAGNDLIVGGAGADTMTGGFGNDTIYVDNAGDVVVEEAGQGTDTVMVNTATYVLNAAAEVEFMVAGAGAINLTGSDFANMISGNSLNNQLWGKAGNDVLTGILGNDRLYGGTGNDRLSGGLGNDQLKGETGRDVFVFDTRTNKSTNVDKVLDFKSSDDSFHLDNAIFTKLGRGSATGVRFKSDMFVEGARAKDREDRIVYDKKTGNLYYDQDGIGSKAQVKIATLSNKAKLYYHDFYVI